MLKSFVICPKPPLTGKFPPITEQCQDLPRPLPLPHLHGISLLVGTYTAVETAALGHAIFRTSAVFTIVAPNPIMSFTASSFRRGKSQHPKTNQKQRAGRLAGCQQNSCHKIKTIRFVPQNSTIDSCHRI